MAETTIADFTIYQEEFHSGVTEVLQQNSSAFNGASAGSITLATMALMGEYAKETFFKSLGTGLVSRRDPTSVSSVTDQQIVHGENVSVKLNRRIGPVKFTMDAFRKIGKSPQEASFIFGTQAGEAISLDYLNAALGAADAALGGDNDYDGTSGTMTASVLNLGMQVLGDRASRIVAWVMHSKVYHDLIGAHISDKITNVADVVIYGGSPGTLGRPVIVTDSSNLLNVTPDPDEYTTLGLVSGGVNVVESEGRTIVSDLITGEDNLSTRLQGEHAFNLGIKGYTWDVTNGAANPNDTALFTATNWDKTASDDKDLAGIRIRTQ